MVSSASGLVTVQTLGSVVKTLPPPDMAKEIDCPETLVELLAQHTGSYFSVRGYHRCIILTEAETEKTA
ncbi:hypothetical protein GJAV_G00101800 [Gymnothorax javanicus]|nr:hypothetical protein GJAV_G00101800 [Gymnothorax javanicus]